MKKTLVVLVCILLIILQGIACASTSGYSQIELNSILKDATFTTLYTAAGSNAFYVCDAYSHSIVTVAIALDCLEYIIQNIDPEMNAAMMPDTSKPMRDADYEEILQAYQNKIDKYDTEIQATDELTSRELTDRKEALVSEMESYMQNSSWLTTEESLADYHTISKHMHMLNANDFDEGTRGRISLCQSRYEEHELSMEQFISEMNRILDMQVKEGS